MAGEDVNSEQKKNNKKLVVLAGILSALAIVSGVWYAVVFRRVNNEVQYATTSPQDELAQDFANEEIVWQPENLPPADVQQRLKEQIDKLTAEAKQKDEAGENSYSDYLGVANSWRLLGDYKKSLEAYQQITERWGDDYLVWHNLGVLYEDMHQYLSAARAYQTSIKNKPVEKIAHLKLADLYVKHSKNPAKAREVYLKALQDTYNDIDVMKAYAVYLERQEKDLREALLYWREIVKKSRNKEAVQEKIKELERKLGDGY